MGTFGSSLLCPNCKQNEEDQSKSNDNVGFIMAKLTKKGSDVTWECNSGGFMLNSVENLCLSIYREVESLVNSVPDRSTIEKFETFIEKYEGSILHPNHMLLTIIKYNLAFTNMVTDLVVHG